MAKTNNLTDFLTGLADKFRSKLGGTALINPQNFESKIDEVYQKGYDDAPKGVDTGDATAAADDVQNGKTFYAGGVKKTGSLNVTAGLVDSAVTVVDEPGNNQIYAQNAGISQKAIYNKNTKTKLLIPYNKVTSAIGLTADKIVSGNTILGVAGTAQTGVDVSDTTATAADVVSSKVFYGADGTKQTGEVYVMDSLAGRITNYGGTITGGSVTDSNGTIGFHSDPYGFPLYLKGTGGFSVDAPYSVVAQAIGLTGDKIVSGNTILGVQGTAQTGGGSETGLFNVQQGASTLQDIVITISNPMQIMPKRLMLMMITDGSYIFEKTIVYAFVAGLIDFETNAATLFGLGSTLGVYTTTASDIAAVSGNTITFSDPADTELYFLSNKTYFYSVEY